MNPGRLGARTRSFVQKAGGVVRKHRPDHQILMYMGILMLLGLVIMYAISPQRANVLNNAYDTDYYTSMYFFIKQAASLGLALAAFVFLAKLPYELIKKHSKRILQFAFLACALLALAGIFNLGIAHCTLGACRWFDLGVFGSLQPAEFLKFGLLIATASFLAFRINQGLINDFYKTLIPVGAMVLLAVIFVIGFQKDMGTGIALVGIVASMLMVGGLSKKVGLGMLVAALVIGIGLIIVAPHRMERVATFLQGDSASAEGSDDANYHIIHAKIAIGSGGLLGVGIGNSVQATGYLPEAINDSVFAIMGETFGFVGLMVILLLFGALLLRLLKVTDHLPDMWMKLVVAGVFGWLGSHVILNVAAMIGVFPLTGITLPLLSFGGTSMIFIAGALGIAYQLSRYTTHTAGNKETDNDENSNSWRRVGGSRYSGSRSSRRA